MKRVIGKFEILVSGGAMVLAIAATFLNVICRYFLNHPIYQAEEIATSAFVWLVFVGAAACYGEGMHIGIDCLVNLLPSKARHMVKIFTDGVMILINAAMAYMAGVITVGARMKLTSALRIPYSFIDMAAVIAFGLMTFHAVCFLIEDFRPHPAGGERGGEA